MAIPEEEINRYHNISWYAKVFFPFRYRQAKRLSQKIYTDCYNTAQLYLKVKFEDTPPHFRDRAWMHHFVFASLGRQSDDEINKRLLLDLSERILTPMRAESALRVAQQIHAAISRELALHNMQRGEFPEKLTDEGWIYLRVMKDFNTKSAEDITKTLLSLFRYDLKEAKIAKLEPRLKAWLQALLSEGSESLYSKEIKSQFSLNSLFLSPVLKELGLDALDNLEENLGPWGNNDEVARWLLMGNAAYSERISREVARKMFSGGGGGGRESTSKGSIGHDRLNVKTLRPSEWRARLAAVLGRARFAA
jgi:hypothetical protein